MVVTRVADEKGRRAGHALVNEVDGRRAGLSQSSVSRIWRAFGLKPHVVETWKLSTDPEFIAKVRDVVGLYLNPPEHALVLASMRSRRSRLWTGPRRACRSFPRPRPA